MTRHVLFTAVKNEAPFLLEWLAFHKAIGFDTIIAFSNPSDDGTNELLAALAQAGEVMHVPHTPLDGVSAQGNAARIANENGMIGSDDWVLWLDADEFLNVHVGDGRLPDLIEVMADNRGMLIPWRIFGDSGNARFPGRFISKDFTRATNGWFAPTRSIKTLFRMGDGIGGLGTNGIHRPRLIPQGGLSHQDFLNADGGILSEVDPVHQRWFAGEDFPKNHAVRKPDFSWKLAQINHYMVRTPEYYALKQMRGRDWASGEESLSNMRHTTEFYTEMNRNERLDTSILQHERAVTDGMARLRGIPDVAQVEALAERKTAMALMRAACVRPVGEPAKAEDFELTLPEDAAAWLHEVYAGARVILEYGSGGSTFVALRAGAEWVMSVESDPDWAARMVMAIGDDAHARIHFADIGAVGDWGRPKGTEAQQRFHTYATAVWDAPWFRAPDVVLVDGRFRVACFLTVMIRTTRPVTVLFDDYVMRPEYQWIEDLVPVASYAGRMAQFDIVPGMAFPAAHLTRIAGAFADAR